MYKFKIETIRRCGPSRLLPTGQGGQGFQLGLGVKITAKVDSVIGSAQDITIEKNGVILQSQVNPDGGATCAPVLSPRQLHKGESASGFAQFEVPDEAFAQSATVVFRPTRWGGAPRVETTLPDCLDHCDAPARKRSGDASSPTAR